MKVLTDKNELRGLFRERLSHLLPWERWEDDGEICNKLLSLPEFQSSHVIMTYLSFSEEVDSFGFAEKVLEKGKRLVVPRVRNNPRGLDACEIHNLEEHLIPNSYGILEPEESEASLVSPEEIDMHVIPALAFDNQGFRLGRGGGYYDRFLGSIAREAFFAGVGYDCQRTDELPREEWDIPVDCIITEEEILRTG